MELVLDRVRLDDRLVIVLAGVASAVAALGKLNVGVFVAAMALITVLAVVRPWWRGLVGYLVVGAVATLALWLVLGQALPDLVAYVRGAAEIISGYSQAMGTDRDPPSRHWIFPVFVGIAALIGWLTVRGTRDAPRVRRLALGGARRPAPVRGVEDGLRPGLPGLRVRDPGLRGHAPRRRESGDPWRWRPWPSSGSRSC